MKYLFALLAGFVLGGVLGGTFASGIGSQGGAVLGLCEMAQTALEEKILSEDQVLTLAERTGVRMRTQMPGYADGLRLTEKQKTKAAEDKSECFKVLQRLSAGIESVK